MSMPVLYLLLVTFTFLYFLSTYMMFFFALKICGKRIINKVELAWISVLLGLVGGFAIAGWWLGLAIMFESYRPVVLSVYGFLTGSNNENSGS